MSNSTFGGTILVMEFIVCRPYIRIFKNFIATRQNFITRKLCDNMHDGSIYDGAAFRK